MALDRRDFLKLAGLAGLSVASPFGLGRSARAQSITYDGPFFVCINAAGGWDPTSLCDPKGAQSEDEENPMNRAYLADAILEAGNIRYAPVGNHQAFFDKYYDRLLVINGVDTQTNGHDSGSRFTWSGKLSEGHPSFGALVAAAKNRTAPMAFLSNGGYDITGGLVAPTRSGNTNVLARIAYPNRPNTGDEARKYHTDDTMERIQAFQRERLGAMMEKPQLPRYRNSMGTLFNARVGENEVQKLTEFLPAELDNTNNPLRRQAQLALASYKAGLSVSVNLNIGGFDTHGNHDANHIPRLGQILEGIDFLMIEAEALGVADQIVVLVGSDFGRTPRYNNTNGKDHWSITSFMAMGPGIQGNRVIGATDADHKPLTVNPDTLALDESGIRVTPEHIHRSMRRLAGIHDHEYAQRFPLNEAGDLALFG